MSSDAALEVLPLGTGNYVATERFPTSLLIMAGDLQILVDCPEPFMRMCKRAAQKSGRRVDPAGFRHIVLTHLHGDHCNGLEAFGFWRKFAVGGELPRIHTSKAVAEKLWQRLEPAMGSARIPYNDHTEYFELGDYYQLSSYEFGDRFEIGGVEIVTRQTLHSVPCFGLRASFGGRTFGYSCDTAFDPEHIEFLKDSDLIFHEAGSGMHTDITKLEALPEEIRRKMRVIHLEDEFEGSDKLEAVEQGRVYRV